LFLAIVAYKQMGNSEVAGKAARDSALAAQRSAEAAQASAKEAEKMRTADNRPAFLIGPSKEGGKPTWSLRNAGKGPATLVCFGFDPPAAEKTRQPAGNREYVPVGDGWPCHPQIVEIVTRKYKDYTRGTSTKQGEKIEYYVQYADIFRNEYRQYFFVNAEGEFIAPGRFEELRKDDKERYLDIWSKSD
jgi:hypothetical protein